MSVNMESHIIVTIQTGEKRKNVSDKSNKSKIKFQKLTSYFFVLPKSTDVLKLS